MKKVFFVGAGPGDPELLTIKGRRLIDEADLVIYAGSLVNPELLRGIKAEIRDSSRMDLEEIVDLITEAVKEGKNVVRLHTGDTAFYSAISEQIEMLRGREIRCEVVPGVSSASSAAAVLGQELTIPEVSQSVIFTRLEGRTPVPESERLRDLARHRSSMVIFLSVGMIDRVVAELTAGGYPPETPAVVVYRASWPDQMVIRGTLGDITGKVTTHNIKKTALILVGDALRASEGGKISGSHLYSRHFSHTYRKQGEGRGKLWIAGIGPGGMAHMSPAVRECIEQAEVIVGYTTYVKLIEPLLYGKDVITTPMTREVERCRTALEEACKGRVVVLVCGGDPGIYALAGLALEILSRKKSSQEIDVEVLPGIPALSACASRLGAPLMHDFACISLSDRLTDWETIKKRLHAASEANFVIVIYNPKSRSRRDHLKQALEIISTYRSPDTPVGIVRAATREDEHVWIATLREVNTEVVDMQSTVIVGNSSTFLWDGMMITPRGYSRKYSIS